jgi:hypothetical protein
MEIVSYGSSLLLYELRPGEHSEHTHVRPVTLNEDWILFVNQELVTRLILDNLCTRSLPQVQKSTKENTVFLCCGSLLAAVQNTQLSIYR